MTKQNAARRSADRASHLATPAGRARRRRASAGDDPTTTDNAAAQRGGGPLETDTSRTGPDRAAHDFSSKGALSNGLVSTDSTAALHRHLADRGADRAVVERWIATGADVNALTEPHGHTGLIAAVVFFAVVHEATGAASREVVDALVRAGADPNRADRNGRTALLWAALAWPELVPLFLTAGGDPRRADRYGATALLAAAGTGHTAAVRALLAAGAPANDAGPNGWTALMFAAQHGHVPTARALVTGGADWRARNAQGATALMVARAHDRRAVAAWLQTLEDRAALAEAAGAATAEGGSGRGRRSL